MAAPNPLLSGLAGRCPSCGEGRLFEGYLKVAPRCEACGFYLAKADSGDGPAVFVILIGGGFTPQKHFGFEAAAWYWHFVDVVWLFLFAAIYVWGAGVSTGAAGH